MPISASPSESCHSPNECQCPDLCKILHLARPAIRDRIRYLVQKGLLKEPPFGSERRLEFVGLKFLPIQVDPESGVIVEEQVYERDDFVITIKRKKNK